MLKMKGLLWSRFQLLEPGPAWEMTLVSEGPPQVVGFAADAAPSASATFEKRSQTLRWGSTPQLSAPLARSLWAAEDAVSSAQAWWRLRRKMVGLWCWRWTHG